jgi:ribose transport system substrate-binding protein
MKKIMCFKGIEIASSFLCCKASQKLLAMTMLVLGLIIFGCAKKSEPNEPAKEAGKKTIVISMIAKSSTNPLFLTGRKGAEDKAKELSDKYGIYIKIDWRTPPVEDGQVQAQRIAQAVNEGTDVILISCSDASKVTGAINDAVDRGVPVMTFDSDAPQSKRFAFYGVDDIETGKMVMGELAKLVKGKANVAILAGNQNAPNLQKREEGARLEAKNYPDLKVVGSFYHSETPQDAAAEVLRVMNAYPEINAWVFIGGWPLLTTTLLTDLDPNKVTVASIDGMPAQLPYVEKGIAPVLLAQPTYLWGAASVELIIDKIYLKKEVPVINKMELVKVTKENINIWAKQLKDWGFSDVPERMLK